MNRRLRFTGSTGAELAAILELPADGRPDAWAIFAHCFTCSKDLRAAVAIARTLADEGIAVLRFDFTGLGQSEGDFADTSFTSNVEDLLAAAGALEGDGASPTILIGHSLGGAAVLQAAHRLPTVRAVATIGAPHDPSHVLRLVESGREQIEREGAATVTIAGRPFRVGRTFLEDLEGDRMDRAIGDLERALLVFHSPLDRVVGIENAARIYEAARHPKSFVSLDTADHLLTDPADARYVARVLAAWAGRYVDVAAPVTDEPVPGVVTATPAGGYRTQVRSGRHALVVDEPVRVGGTDEGPTPYDLLAAALGACTGMTLRMYADRKSWPLGEVQVDVRHGRVHADHGGACDDPGSCVDRLSRRIRLEGDLTGEQRTRLLEIADRCPVHRTLERGVRIETVSASP